MELRKNVLRKELCLPKNKAHNLGNFSTFAAILKIIHPQYIAIPVRTPPDLEQNTASSDLFEGNHPLFCLRV